ncbi:MAG: SulP family inorganic anion transporter [Pirellulales bacterium]
MHAKSPRDSSSWLSNTRHDLMASVVVFLVALPLSMGIAIASGMPVAAGLITAIVGGIIVGALAGCPLQVSGPAAGLTVIVFEVVQRFGIEMLGVVVLIAGVIQLAAGTFRLGQWFRAVSPAVIKGMLAGIGILIVASQFHVMVDDKPHGSGIDNLLAIPAAISKSVAVPDFPHQDVARFRMHALEQIGELHREQQYVGERAAEVVPHKPGADTAVEDASVDLSPLQSEQQRIVEHLAIVTDQLQEFELQPKNGERSKQILAAAAGATAACETALDVIKSNDARAALSSQHAAVESFENLLGQLKNHHLAAEIGLLTIAALLTFQAFAPRRLRVLPAPLVAVAFATLLARVLTIPVLYVEVPDYLWHEIHFPSFAVLGEAPWRELFAQGLLIAVVASAETLLCAAAVDQLHTGPRANFDRELCAHGFGNMLCGLVGALPMTGVIVRSYANVQAGGRTRLSAILHGVWILVFVALLSGVLRMIPTSALAAILVYTGYKLVDFKAIRDLWRYGWGEVVIYTATVVTIVVADLLTGVLVGIALAAGKLLYMFSHLDVYLESQPAEDKATLSLRGSATFVRLPQLATMLSQVSPDTELHINLEQLHYIDHACLDLLKNWTHQHESNGGSVVIDWDGLHARNHASSARRIGQAKSNSFEKRDDAVDAA